MQVPIGQERAITTEEAARGGNMMTCPQDQGEEHEGSVRRGTAGT
jgi:hypothetical protein